MNLRDKHADFCLTADVVMAPLVGVMFIVISVLVALLGRVNMTGGQVTLADQPVKFITIVAVGVAVGIALCLFGWLRYRWHRRRAAERSTS